MRRAIINQTLLEQSFLSAILPKIDESDVGVIEAPVEQDAPPGSGGEGYRVILYNDDHHYQHEVAEQLQKATEYPMSRCWDIMMEAHRKGRAICYHGSRERCHRVARILREISLQCEVDCD